MSISAAVVTTFGNSHWEVYAKQMLQSFAEYWPAEIPILVALDDDLLGPDVDKIVREQDAISIKWLPEHAAFVERNKDKDHQTDYRKQAVRFCHKVFAIKQALNAIEQMPDNKPRYLIWMDADVITTRKVTVADIEKCLPKEGDAFAYLGRKDWDHSECGWLAFDLKNEGINVINRTYTSYIIDAVLSAEQQHDSWIWDQAIKLSGFSATNLTDDKPGIEIWPHSPMAAWSKHYKGPVAKQDLVKTIPQKPKGNSGLTIQTKNSVPDELIQKHILENQAQIKNWLVPCTPTKEEIIVVSAGPMLIAEDLEAEKGKKIVAVKHALEPLKAAGITPWACILLDPRDHLTKFVEKPDTNVLWFVASQVDPRVVRKLLDDGCTVWGYHAAVGAGEGHLTERQASSIVSGGSATATRGLFLLNLLGYSNFRLHGYDLCFPDKPNLNELDQFGQPQNFEMSFDIKTPFYEQKRAFWTKAELLAQYQEMNDIITNKTWNIKAFGQGLIPFVVNARRINDLRKARKDEKISFKPVKCEDLLNGRHNSVNGKRRGSNTAGNRRRKATSK